jgi:hypothetical protein
MAPVAAALPSANTSSRLGKVQRGRLKAPLRYLFYGPEGIGKSSLAANSPKPIFIDCEDGSGRLDIPRYPFRDEPGGHVPTSYDQIVAAVDDLLHNEHDYQNLVIDTADRLESLIWQKVCKRESKVGKELTSIEDFGYGRGFSIAFDEWRAFCAKLDRLRTARGMGIILLGHSQIKAFRDPEGDDYDRYSLRIHEKAAGFLREWADITGFCHFEEGSAKLDGGSRPKGFSTGRRLIKLQRTAAYDAKTRFALPAEIELDAANPWGPFAKAVDDSINLDVPTLQKLISGEVDRIGDAELKPKVQAAVAEAVKRGEVEALHRFLNDLKKRPAKQAGQGE